MLSSASRAIFLASMFGLFLELALIRWLSCEVRVFAYCKNLVLVASFLGFGTGCFLSGRRPLFLLATGTLLAITAVVCIPSSFLDAYGPPQITVILSELPRFMIFRNQMPHLENAWGLLPRLAFAVGWTTLLFFAVALIVVPFGQVTAAGIARLRNPIRAYSINVIGSLVGILAYTAVTALWLPPSAWFLIIGVGVLVLAPKGRAWAVLLAMTVGIVLITLPAIKPDVQTAWSSYQKLSLDLRRRWIVVNNTGFQQMVSMAEVASMDLIHRFNLPYRIRKPVGRVLIVGAGSGNDVSAALFCGATSVTAVEIDPMIYGLGRQFHPNKPYEDPRVRVVIDDARHFLKTSTDAFDLIVFSHLDSHTLLSSYTTVRLDNYIYTRQAFEEARRHLAPDGILYVSYFSEQPFIGKRLNRNLSLAFGHDPVWMEGSRTGEVESYWRNIYFLTGESALMGALQSSTATLKGSSTSPTPSPPSCRRPTSGRSFRSSSARCRR